jgi:amino acid adenylation domain-containing protein
LAHQLIERGVGPEVRVGLCLERSAQLVIGLLGILKAGGCYVPLDPQYPRKRLEYLLEDAQVPLLVSEARVAERVCVSGAQREVLWLDEAEGREPWASEPWASERVEEVDKSALGLRSEHPAYLIYTSASTGAPKAVVGLHRSIVNRVSWLAGTRGVGRQEVLCQKTSVGFVDHVAEVFQALSAGVPLVMMSSELVHRPREWLRRLDERGVTRMTLVPSLLKTVLEAAEGESARGLRWIHSSGEALHLSGLERLGECFPQARLLNIYGSTEVGADVTWEEVPRESVGGGAGAGEWARIGKGIDNAQLYVLDGEGQLSVSGAVGELHVGGVCLARGYFKRAGVTAQKFVPHPFSEVPGERLYRTGDLARWLPEGKLEYLGRVDQQVKVRGYRIELGEIESVLLGQAGVRAAVVVAREEADGNKRLVGYVVAEDPDEAALVNELRSRLQEQLPAYMVPSVLMVLESLPLTANGKVDRKGLPAPHAEEAHRPYEPPEGKIERVLAQLWQELLRVERVGRCNHFFDLGGHSLLATQLIARIRKSFRVELPIRDVFERSTLRELALAIEAREKAAAFSASMSDQLRRLDETRNALVAAGQAVEEGEI